MITTSPYNVVTTDNIISCDTTVTDFVINLPEITIGYKKQITIVDGSGNAFNNNILITPALNQTTQLDPDGILMNTNFQSISIISDGNSNWIIV